MSQGCYDNMIMYCINVNEKG